MKKVILLFLLVTALIPSAKAETGHLLDRVVAVVNGEVITESELDTYLQPLYEQLRAEYKGQQLAEKIQEARNQLLNQLIEDRLVFQEADKQGVKVEPTEIDTQLEQIKAQTPQDRDFEDLLRQQGLSLKELRERLRRQIMIRRLHDTEIRSKIVVSPAEMEEYYQAHQGEFVDQEMIKVRSITIKKSDEAQEKGILDEVAMNQIRDLHKQALAGKDFGELAKAFSQDTKAKDGGLSDWIKHGEMIPEIDQIIFQTGAGNITEVIETPMGYHLFKIEEVRQAATHSYEEVRDFIQNLLFRKKFQEKFDEWLGELKRNAYISLR
ncbi:MAG: SurA N-terminal domain-containing protein [Candidatus Omnitrophota bacterium]|jgi:parvulin-like peptidyl-prolyl isomerase